jgi:type II secretory pathway pseudopilin PulG
VQPGGQAPKTPYALPGVALALSIGGLCICISSVVGAILGIVALLRIHREPQLRGHGLAIAAIVVAVGLVPFQAGVLAAIAIPNFIRYQARAKQSECRTNLRAIWRAQQTYRATHGRAATQFSELDVSIPPGNRYAYLLASGELLPVDVPFRAASPVDPAAIARRQSTGLEGHFVAACIGNIDRDDMLDVWTVSDEDEQLRDETSVPAGTPRNQVNDVAQ